MRLFLDTANLEEIRTGVAWGVVSGVTTNPTLIAKEGADHKARVKEICHLVDGDVSAEVLATDTEKMVKEGRTLAELHENVVVKIPCTADGLQAIRQLSQTGVRVNTTLVFSANQALLAALAGATYVSPFIGRVDDVGGDGIGLVQACVDLFDAQGLATQVLAASIRHPLHVLQSALAGAHAATLPFGVLEKMVRHPQTDAGLQKFLKDAEKGGLKI